MEGNVQVGEVLVEDGIERCRVSLESQFRCLTLLDTRRICECIVGRQHELIANRELFV